MTLREQFTARLKEAMLAKQPEKVSALRMITARLKDVDIAARPKGITQVPDEEVIAMLRGMVKSRRESVDLYKQGGRAELVAKEEAEITVIESFLPQQMDPAALEAAVAEAVAETGAASVKDMGKVMAVLKAKHGAVLDMGKAGPLVKAKLGGLTLALPSGFLDELRARTPLASLVGRRVKLSRSGKNWKGCCPFHNEKTPSFYLYDDRFHCFGCGASGDALSFAMQTQGLGFMEAVEQLAGEAGLEVPKPTPAAAEAERRRHSLQDVLEAAQAAYVRRLFLPEGARALDYLRGRGLSDETIARFGLGWSGEGRGALAAELAVQGIEADMLLEAGLMRPGDEGRAPYDLFFNRVMFPIRDRRGRVISFGGRILGDGQPKYVNGPETAMFSKRRTLFALDLARIGVRAGRKLVVVEGYMDVIALHQAGFDGAVAPLGTALTEEQLEELWRLSPQPHLCFDGDLAGVRAAMRTAELALPSLGAERTLRLVTLPSGEDPDTLVRNHGVPAFQSLLDTARPVVEALYDLLAEGVGNSVEARAGLSRRLDEAAGRIADKALCWEVRQYFRERLRAARPRRAAAPQGGGRGRFAAVKPPPRIVRITARPETAAVERARALVAILLRHPGLLADVEEAFAAIELPEALSRLREAILHWSQTAEVLDREGLMSHLTHSGLALDVAQALSAAPVPLPGCASADAMPGEAGAGWWHFFGLMNPGRLEEEVAAASRDFAAQADEAAQRRLIALSAARDALRRGEFGESDA